MPISPKVHGKPIYPRPQPIYDENTGEEIVFYDSKDKKVISSSLAQAEIRKFLHEEIGSFIDSGFVIEKQSILDQIDKEINSLKEHINKKLDKVTEEIVSELRSSHVKEEIRNKVSLKLEEIKNNL
jgi:vacuolar-type H+-ATPase subunit I/STV1